MPIVPADPHHIDAAWSLIARCRADLTAEGIFQWDDVYPTRQVVETDVAERTIFVFEDAGECAGCITLNEEQDPRYAQIDWAHGEPALVVHRLCVDPARQGQGIAHQLMTFAEELAARRAYASIRLDAYSVNPRSLALYRRRGYRDAGMLYFPRRPHPFHLFERPVNR